MAQEKTVDDTLRARVVSAPADGKVRAWLGMAARACGGRSAFAVRRRADGLRVATVGDAPAEPMIDSLSRVGARGVSRGLAAADTVTVVVVDPMVDADDKERAELLDGVATVIAGAWLEGESGPPEGAPISGTVSAHDDAAQRSEANYRALVEQSPEGVMVHRDGCIVYANEAIAAFFGRARAYLVGARVTELVTLEDRDFVEERVRALGRMQRAPTRRLRGVRGDGSEIELDFTGIPIFWDGAPAALSIVRDVSDTSRIERQLLASERMASVGTLAAGVAHELNNPLSYVVTNVEFARNELTRTLAQAPNAAELREVLRALEEADKGAERVRQIVQGLRTFSRVEDDRRVLVDVQRTLELALDMAANEIRHRAHVRRIYKPVPRVEANESRLGQVFLNLLLNAAQAIAEGSAPEHEIMVATYVDADGRVVIEIGDTGCGMSRDVRDRAFEPFFTTKPVGVGTGLGLSVARNVVRSLGGEIVVDSMAGVGTMVHVTLPRADPTARAATTIPEPVTANRRARVLVIDDEPMIGTSIRRILAAQHDVEHTTRAVEALEKIRVGARFDAILCDLMMPELTGMDVYEALANEFPDQAARMIFLTGGTFTERARAFVEARPHRVASKPFKSQLLRDMIAALLEG